MLKVMWRDIKSLLTLRFLAQLGLSILFLAGVFLAGGLASAAVYGVALAIEWGTGIHAVVTMLIAPFLFVWTLSAQERADAL